jgi:uncharacterized repeat protein (TIGR01451 family)
MHIPALNLPGARARQLATLLLGLFFLATARADIELDIQARREVQLTQEDGSILIRQEPATRLQNGDRLILTIHYQNTSEEAADRVIIENPLPEQTLYEPGGASGDGATIEVSIDGGQSFVEESGVNPGMVTHVRWTVASVPAGAGGEVTMRLRVFKRGASAP